MELSKADKFHKIFRAENLSGARLDREKLMPAILLVSRLMTTDRAFRFWWTVSFAKRESRTPPVTMPQRKRDWHYEYPDSKLTTEQFQATLDALNELACNVTFDIDNDNKEWRAYCENFRRLNIKATAPFPEDGTKSNVLVNPILYDHLYEELPPKYHELMQLDMALTLLHELAHAASRIARPQEEGLELVVSIFDGHICPHYVATLVASDDGKNTVRAYTEPVFVEDPSGWHTSEHSYGLKLSRDPGKAASSTRSWLVDMDWVVKLFEDDFWSDISKHGEQGLRPKLRPSLRSFADTQSENFAKENEADAVVKTIIGMAFKAAQEVHEGAEKCGCLKVGSTCSCGKSERLVKLLQESGHQSPTQT